MRSTTIRIFVLFFSILHFQFSISSEAQAQIPASLPPYNLVQGKLIFNQSYCGGARPSEEMLAQYDSLRILPNTTVYLSRKPGGQIIYKLISDGKGNIKKKMRAGKYYLYMTRKYDKDVLSNFNPACDRWMKSHFGEVEIMNGGKRLYNIALHFGCDPCSPPRP